MQLNLDLENYILSNIDDEDVILQELNRETNLRVIQARMISGQLQGQFLTMLSKMINPLAILEIGTFTGYSAICLSKGLKKGGKLYTIEIDDELEAFASRYFKKAGITNSVVQIIGAAFNEIPKLDTLFDLVFIDADKNEYCRYYELIFDKVQPGGYIIADNTLWSGKVINSPEKKNDRTRGIIEFNKMVKSDPRVEKVIVPIRDGLTIIRKK